MEIPDGRRPHGPAPFAGQVPSCRRGGRIAVQAARGVAKAHAAGVVHRDLKPANIFLAQSEDDQPLVKILDFGVSKVKSAMMAGSRLRVTRAGTVVGTPQYMSPEQAQGFAIDERTDVWSLGLVLYEMLAGRPAYPELDSYEAFIVHLVTHPPDPLSSVAPFVPEGLADVVHAAIQHDREARIPSCTVLARRLLDAHPITGVRPSAVVEQSSADDSQVRDSARAVKRNRSKVSTSGIREGGDPPSVEDAPQFFYRRAPDASEIAAAGGRKSPVAVAITPARRARAAGSPSPPRPSAPLAKAPPPKAPGYPRVLLYYAVLTIVACSLVVTMALALR